MNENRYDQPLVYIILVNYNGFDDTIECVKSLRKINYKNFKIVIIDNSSQDNSEDILRHALKECIIIQSGANLGFAGANNLGIKYSEKNNADYILLLNNDTIVTENFLDQLVETAQKKENMALTIGKIYYYSNKNKIWYAGGYFSKGKGNVYHYGDGKEDIGNYDLEKYVTYATGCCILIPKNIIDSVGLLDESYFLYYEDADYCCRVIEKGYQIYYQPKSVIYHKVSSSTGCFSPLIQYYYYRNRSIFINRFIRNKFEKIIAFTYYFLTILMRVFKKKQNNKVIIMAITDFIKGKVGNTFNNF